MRSGMIKIWYNGGPWHSRGVDDWSVDGRDAAGGVDDSDRSGWEPLPRAEPLTVPEVHYRVKHSPYKSELVRYGQFQFNDASWGLQGEYACASCHYERARRQG